VELASCACCPKQAAGRRLDVVHHEPRAEVFVDGFGEELAHGSAWRWNNRSGICFVTGVYSLAQLPGLAQVDVASGARGWGRTTPTPLAFPPLIRGNRRPRAFGVAGFAKGECFAIGSVPAISVSWLCVDRVGCACSKSDRRGLLAWRGSQSVEGISASAVWLSVCLPPSRFVP
jgi:hypothetical protein